MKLLMITGLGSARDLASGKKGAFYNTLEEFSKYWERIDIIAPKTVQNVGSVGNDGNDQFEQVERSNKQIGPTTRTVNLFGNVYVHVSPWPLVFHPFWFLKKGIKIYKEQKFDLMTVHEFPPFYNGIGARLLWSKIKVPYVLEILHIPGYPKVASVKEWFYARPILWKIYCKFVGSRVRAVRVMNRKQVPEFLARAGVPENKIFYIPAIYIDLDVFKPLNLSKEYDLIFTGRLAENKGINLLLEAMLEIKKLRNGEMENISLLVVGDGPLKESLKFKVKSLKLEDNFIFWGWAKDQREIAELINKSKVLIMPSYNEGGPRVVVEAMACGVPVLATNVGLMPDLADKNAVKIVDWDAEDIAKKAKDLLENAEERERLSKIGLEIAGQFEKKEMIKNYAEKIKQLT